MIDDSQILKIILNLLNYSILINDLLLLYKSTLTNNYQLSIKRDKLSKPTVTKLLTMKLPNY